MYKNWNADILGSAKFDGFFEFPVLKNSCSNICGINKIIPFSKAINSQDTDCWVCFYEFDYLFERLWNNPKKYLQKLKMFRGIITPDFSMYQDMPLIQQIYNLYRQRAIGQWLENEGVRVIANIRWSDERTYLLSTQGLECSDVISIGSLGCIKKKECRNTFYDGLDYVLKKLKPKYIIIYGPLNKMIKKICDINNTTIVNFKAYNWRDYKKEW